MQKKPRMGRTLHRALSSASAAATPSHTVGSPRELSNESRERGSPSPFFRHPLKRNVGEAHPSPATTDCGCRNQGPLQARPSGPLAPHPQLHPGHKWSMDKARRPQLGQRWKPAWRCHRRLQRQQGAERKCFPSPSLGPGGRVRAGRPAQHRHCLPGLHSQVQQLPWAQEGSHWGG